MENFWDIARKNIENWNENQRARRKEVDEWIKEGKEKGAIFLIVVCDTFSYEDYPVYIMPEDDINEIRKRYDRINMQTIMEEIKL